MDLQKILADHKLYLEGSYMPDEVFILWPMSGG